MQVFRGSNQTRLGQLLHLSWTRQLALCEDNANGQLPGIDVGADPAENLLWVLVGFDAQNLQFPISSRFNAEDSLLFMSVWSCFWHWLGWLQDRPFFTADDMGEARKCVQSLQNTVDKMQQLASRPSAATEEAGQHSWFELICSFDFARTAACCSLACCDSSSSLPRLDLKCLPHTACSCGPGHPPAWPPSGLGKDDG